MPDLSNAEIGVEGEYGYCLMCGESFHWEQLTNTEAGSYCEAHVPTRPQRNRRMTRDPQPCEHGHRQSHQVNFGTHVGFCPGGRELERGMYGISKDGAAPYVYFDYAPKGQWSEYGDRLLAVNRRQQPDAVFEIVGPFTDADREWHIANPTNWEGRYTDVITRLIGGLAEVWRMPDA